MGHNGRHAPYRPRRGRNFRLVGKDRREQRFRDFEQRLHAQRPHPAELAGTPLVHPEELSGEPARPLSAKEQATVANFWGEVLGYDKERVWVEVKERGSVLLTEVREALAEAA